MRQIDRAALGCLFIGLACPLARGQQPDAPLAQIAGEYDRQLAADIDALNDPSSAVRKAARERVLARGVIVRDAVAQATMSSDPGVAQAAKRLLLELPWFYSSDPPRLKQALLHYGTLEEQDRRAVVRQIAEQIDQPTVGVLLRVLEQDPSDAVAWEINSALWPPTLAGNPVVVTAVSRLTSRRPAALVLRARALYATDRLAAEGLLVEALRTEASIVSAEADQIEWPVRALLAGAADSGDVERQLWLLRLQCQLRPEDAAARADLFALHARLGPFEGFSEDLAAGPGPDEDPRVLYALSRICERLYANGIAGVLRQTAREAAHRLGQPDDARFETGSFCLRQGWYWDAESELTVALQAAVAADEDATVNANLRLADLYQATGRWNQAADHLERALSVNPDNLVRRDADNEPVPLPEAESRGRIAWFRFMAAKANDDKNETLKHARAVADSGAAQGWLFLEVLPTLEAEKDQKRIASFFERAYDDAAADLARRPNDPGRLNELAWLCARSGLRAEEALALAQRATATAPNEASYQDTLGEALFRTGRFDEAAGAERRALELKPGDSFMQEQLEKFEKAAAAER